MRRGDADVLYAFKSRGFGGEVGLVVFHSQHPTKTINLSAFSVMSGTFSFFVDSVNHQI